MPVIKRDGYGVYREGDGWWFKTYKADDPQHGPFENRNVAMEMLLASLGFDVVRDTTPAVPSRD